MAKVSTRSRRRRQRVKSFKLKQRNAGVIAARRNALQTNAPNADLSFRWNEQPIPGWGRTRQWILRRDKFHCRGCALSARAWDAQKGHYIVDYEILQVHHIVPRRYGGDEMHDNLISLCAGCHLQVEMGLIRSGILKQWGQVPFAELKRKCQEFTASRLAGFPIPASAKIPLRQRRK